MICVVYTLTGTQMQHHASILKHSGPAFHVKLTQLCDKVQRTKLTVSFRIVTAIAEKHLKNINNSPYIVTT